MVSSVPKIQIYVTNIEHQDVTQDPLWVHLLEVNVLNEEKDMGLHASIKFLTHNTGRRLSQLDGRLVGNGCSLRSKFPHQEIHRWHEGRVWIFARRVGNILKAFRVVSLELLLNGNGLVFCQGAGLGRWESTVHRCQNKGIQKFME